MSLYEIFRQTVATFRAHKMRIFLTMFGIVWGIASVILLVGLGKGFSSDQKRRMQTLGKDLVIVWGGRTSSQIGGLAAGREISLTIDDARLIRNRLKMNSAVTNAEAFVLVQKEFGSFDKFIWQFVGGTPRQNRRGPGSPIPAASAESDAMSKELKRRGFRFIGSTICYAFMQATGMVNDHNESCFRYPQLAKNRK